MHKSKWTGPSNYSQPNTRFYKYRKWIYGSLQLQSINIGDLIYETRNVLLTKAAKKDVKITSQIDQGIEDIVADREKLKNILYNLVENAIKFTHDEGSINVEVKRDNNVVLFLVHDTGIGIENENIERIFEPFVQMDGSISRKIDGTGLGLALVKKRIEMHGGHIRIESELGKGSIFIFEIPLNSSIPVIAITASYRGNDDREFYLKSGFSEYIFKPMTVDNMKDILRIYLEPPNH